MKKHETPAPFKCKMENCAKTFRSKIGLIQHEASHTGEFKFSCDVCGKGMCLSPKFIPFQVANKTFLIPTRFPNQKLSDDPQENPLECQTVCMQHLWTGSESETGADWSRESSSWCQELPVFTVRPKIHLKIDMCNTWKDSTFDWIQSQTSVSSVQEAVCAKVLFEDAHDHTQWKQIVHLRSVR